MINANPGNPLPRAGTDARMLNFATELAIRRSDMAEVDTNGRITVNVDLADRLPLVTGPGLGMVG